jgi:hypothetical protein
LRWVFVRMPLRHAIAAIMPLLAAQFIIATMDA